VSILGVDSLKNASFKRQSLVCPKTFNFVEFDRSRIDLPIQQINEEGKRSYQTPDGNKYPSITTVMSWLSASAIAEWRRRVGNEEANRVSKKATKRGTALHTVCENYIANEEDLGDVQYDVRDLFQMIRPIIDDIDNVYCQETRLYSDYIGVAGTADCIAEFRGRRSIIDFKTSKKIKTADMIHSYFMQASGYAVMFEELTGIAIPQLVIIMASDEGPVLFVEKRDNWINKLIDNVICYKAAHS